MWKSLPSGEPRRLIRLAIPVALSSLGNMLMGLVDTMIVGRYSSLELAGVAAGNSISVALTVTGVGYLAGMDPIVAQAYGAGDKQTSQECLAASLQQAVLFSLIASPLGFVLAETLAWTGMEPGLAALAKVFLQTMSLSILPYMLWQALQRYWQAREVAMPFTIITLVGNLANFALAWIFVNGFAALPAQGGRGVAWATAIVRVLSLFAALAVSLKWARRPAHAVAYTQVLSLLRQWPRQLHQRLFRLSAASAGHIGLEVGAFSLTTLIVAQLSAIDLATHQIVLNIASFAFMIPLGISAATATRVGYHWGARQRPAAYATAWLAMSVTVATMIFLGLILFVIPEFLLSAFTHDAAVINLALPLLLICALFQVFDGLQVVSGGVLRGLGDTKTALKSNFLAHWLVGLPCGTALCFVMDYGLKGLWSGLALGLFLTALLNSFAIERKQRLYLSQLSQP